MCSNRKGSRELCTLSLSVGRALCCLHSRKVTAQWVWYPWCSCTAPECLAHWAVQQKADATEQLSLMQSPLSGTSRLHMPLQLHLRPTLEVCALESEMKDADLSVRLRAAVIPRPQPWGFYPRCQLIALHSGTSLDPRSSLCSQAFYCVLTPISTRGTTW